LKRRTTLKNFSKILLIALGFSMLTIVLGSLTTRPAPAQSIPPTVPVTVKNTTAQPVPTSAQGMTTVTGSVAISGIPTVALAPGSSVNVNNLPAVQIANGSSVNVVGTTTVLLNQFVSLSAPATLDTSAYHEIRVSILGVPTGTALVSATDGASPIQIAKIDASSTSLPFGPPSQSGSGSALIELPGRTIEIRGYTQNDRGVTEPIFVLVEGR
jgi:hypothetical protein